MHVDIVTFEPGAVIPFEETHVMEHGLYVLEGKAVYRLNRDWGGGGSRRTSCGCARSARRPSMREDRGRFRYLLYKDVNRLPRLALCGAGR